jgi:hypothetical protein
LQGIRQFLVDQGIANPEILGPGIDITLTGDGQIKVGKSSDMGVSADVSPAAAPVAATPPVDYKGMEPGSVPATERAGPAPASPWIGQPALTPIERRLEFQKKYDAMPPGTIYVDPNGKTRRKGGAKGKTSEAEGKGTKVASIDQNIPNEEYARMVEWEGLLDQYLEQGVIDPEQREQMRTLPTPTSSQIKQVKGRNIPQDDATMMWLKGERSQEPARKQDYPVPRPPTRRQDNRRVRRV